VVEERAVEIQSLMFIATSIVQRPSIYVLPVENDPEKPGSVRVLQEKPDNKDIEKLALSQFWIIGGQHFVQADEHLFDIMTAARNLWVSHGSPSPTSRKSVEGPYGVSFHFPRPNRVSDGEHSVSPWR
jgi:hypothetical protein